MREGVAQYLGKARKCSCGRVHETPLKRVVIEQDALQKVPGILEELGYHRVFLVAEYLEGSRRSFGTGVSGSADCL